jgi:glycine dehydrogenase subunit 1
MAAMGNEGIRNAAVQSTSKAHYMAAALAEAGFRIENGADFFNEFVTVSEKSSQAVLDALEAEGILGGLPLDDHRILWCCTEMNSKEEIDAAVSIVKGV